MDRKNYKIEIFSRPNEKLKKNWQDFEKKSFGYCFQTYDWFENWTKNFRSSENDILCVAVVSNQDKILLILPLEIIKRYNLKILQWLGDKHADYFSPIICKDFNLSKDDFNDLWRQIRESIPTFDLIFFMKQPKLIENTKNPFVFFLKNHRDSSIYNILLPKTWNEYSQNILKKKFRTQNLRSKKLLKKLGKISFKIIYKQSEKINYISELFIQKNKQLRSASSTSFFDNKDINFYKGFEDCNLRTIKTHISYLKLDGKLIAAHWGIVHKNRFYYLVPSLDAKDLSKYSPGRLLISLLIKWSISKRIDIFDFTLGDENYKKSWSNNGSQLYNYVYLNSFKGFFLFMLLKTKLVVKSLDRHHYIKKNFLMIKNIFTKKKL